MNVLLSDFGNAFQRGDEVRRSSQSNEFFMCQGSYEYAAPEVMLGLRGVSRDFRLTFGPSEFLQGGNTLLSIGGSGPLLVRFTRRLIATFVL